LTLKGVTLDKLLLGFLLACLSPRGAVPPSNITMVPLGEARLSPLHHLMPRHQEVAKGEISLDGVTNPEIPRGKWGFSSSFLLRGQG
jgi:hypothetical protein